RRSRRPRESRSNACAGSGPRVSMGRVMDTTGQEYVLPGRRVMSAGTRRAIGLLVMVNLSIPFASLAADPAQRERGRYIAHDVAMCVQCHTPRDASGARIDEEEFIGAASPVAAPSFIADGAWCVTTPRIAGLPCFTDDEAVELFMNGARLGRHQPKW